MSQVADALFAPFNRGTLRLRNRVAMAPMTRWQSSGGLPGEDVAAYYRRRAENECGLIITEGTTVDHPVSAHSLTTPSFHGRQALDAWRRVVEGVHEAGACIVPQLWHVGAMRYPSQVYPNPHLPTASPSGLYMPGKPANAEPMSKKTLGEIIDSFARAAGHARELEFDGIELHGAHGYLIDQFFWPELNRRTDEYGGDLSGRARFAVEVIEAIRREIGDDFPLIFRLSQWKQQDYGARLAQTPAQLGELLGHLSDAGVDIFHCSQRRFWEPEFEGSNLNLAGWAKRLTGKPTITVGSVGLKKELVGGSIENLGISSEVADLDAVVSRLEQGEFDLVAVGRGMLADPQWARKIKEGRSAELRPFGPEVLNILT